MIAALLLGALVVDLALVAVGAHPSGFSRTFGPIHIRLHDPSTALFLAPFLIGALVAACWRGRARGWALGALPLAAGAAGVALTEAAPKMFPLGDIAIIELFVRNVEAGRLLTGPYSRFGWHHPGPVYFYALAPFYAAAGHTTASLAAGAAVISTAAIALVAWTGARSLGSRGTWTVAAIVVLYLVRIPELAVSPWNPHVVVLPEVALVVAAAAAAGGDVFLLPLVAALASFAVQTDVALVPVSAALSAAACAAGCAAAWPKDRWKVFKALNVTAWLVAVLWLLPVAEEWTRSPGNLTLLWKFFAGSRASGQTLASAAGAWSAMLTAPLTPGFALAGGGTFRHGVSLVRFVLAATELAGVATVAWRFGRRDRALSRLAIFSLGASLVALWSATRIEGAIMDHEVFWISALGALNVAVIAAPAASIAASAILARVPALPRSGALAHGTLVAVVAAICFAQVGRARQGRLPVTPTSPVVERLAGSVRQYVESQAAHKPLVRIGEDVWGMTAGVLLESDRTALPFSVETSWMPMFPESFAADGDEDAEVAFGNGNEHLLRTQVPGDVSIATFAPLYIDGVPHQPR